MVPFQILCVIRSFFSISVVLVSLLVRPEFPSRGALFQINFFDGTLSQIKVHMSKQIPYLVSLNSLVLESIKISSELIVYFSMKIKNSDYRGDPLNTFQIFSRVSKINFLIYIKTHTVLLSLNTLVLESIKMSSELIVYISMKIKN